MDRNIDLYEILGVSKSASLPEIKKAYRDLVRQFHPDRNPDPSAREKFIAVQKAYEILADPSARYEYDQGKKSAVTDKPKTFLSVFWDTLMNQGLKSKRG
ncbi:MAG: DnaJ domain-containing protein [Candidatus Parcubacteria bacterium]|nr:DnaJ domain-containing protein [Candidatus Parcubacteria bacterium]